MPWGLKLAICIGVDLFDMTFGRLLFVIPFGSEIVGAAVGCALFGKSGLFYLVEALDVTEQLDGFVPTATIIAMANKNR